MKISLKTDYLDCYDHWFDRDGDVVWHRMACDSWGTSRERMFEVFRLLGLAHPKFSSVGLFHHDTLVVVHVDPYAHQGEGKLLIADGDARRLYVEAAQAALARGKTRLTRLEVEALIEEFRPRGVGAPERGRTLAGALATEYVGDFPGLTYRLLSCGRHTCWFRHESFDDWRSNAGDGDLGDVKEDEVILPSGFETCVLNPVWAIDFVAKKSDGGPSMLLAIDLNTAPRVAGTPLARRVNPLDLASAIRETLEGSARSSRTQNVHEGRAVIDNNHINLADKGRASR